MTTAPHPLRFALTAAVSALVAAFVAAFLLASPAAAHDELIGADPAPDAVVDVLPDELTLTFSGVLIDEPGATELSVLDTDGVELVAGSPELDGTRVTQALTGDADGQVHVLWRVVSSDGHPISGEFTFSIGEAGPTSPTPPEVDEQAGSPVWWWAVAGAAVIVIAVVAAVVIVRSRGRRGE